MKDSREAQRIRRLPWSSRPAEDELSASPALLSGMEPGAAPVLHWHKIVPAALLLGSSQRLGEIDLGACAARGIPAHRRRSGGGAVLSGADLLQLDLALPRGHPLYREDVTESYRWIGAVWAAALRRLGLDAAPIGVAEARADTAALDALVRRVCFGGHSPYETLVDGRKVVGLAQIRRRGGALYQAGVYLRWDPAQSAELIAAEPQERAALAQRLAERVAGLDELGAGQPAAALIAAFETELTEATGMQLEDDGWSEMELRAQAQDRERYAALAL